MNKSSVVYSYQRTIADCIDFFYFIQHSVTSNYLSQTVDNKLNKILNFVEKE